MQKGTKHSEETRRKMSDSQKKVQKEVQNRDIEKKREQMLQRWADGTMDGSNAKKSVSIRKYWERVRAALHKAVEEVDEKIEKNLQELNEFPAE